MDWNDFPDTDDIKVKSKRTQKSDDEVLEDRIYQVRCKLVAKSHNDYFEFIQFIKDNEKTLQKMKPADKECMRSTCQRVFDRSYDYNQEDYDYINNLFGRYIDPRSSETIPTYGMDGGKDRPKTVEEEIKERSLGSYNAMWEFITNPHWQEKLKGRTDLHDKVKFMIDRAKENNDCVKRCRFKEYEPSDEVMFEKVLNLMKEVKE